MAIYKGFQVDDDLYRVIRYMPVLEEYRQALERQQVMWDYLAVMAQLEHLDNDLNRTSQQFNQLTGLLLNRLGKESMRKVVGEYAFKAQVAIDILVRNLFERTADIGFLAEDADICRFLKSRTIEDNNSAATQLQQRFRGYTEKYSVYEDVVLLGTNGQILVRLDDSLPLDLCKDRLIQTALTTQAPYVEKFGYSDLRPAQPNALIYACKVQDSHSESADGVIALCFKFEDEIAGIFQRLLKQSELETMLLLDADDQVISSSNTDRVPLGFHLKIHPETVHIVSCRGKEYLCCMRAAHPYQGYAGPGWQGCVLLPIDGLFSLKDSPPNLIQTELNPDTLHAIMQGPLFDADIRSIPEQAAQIEHELNRSVWNGNARLASEKNETEGIVSRVLLDKIKQTGFANKVIFDDAIANIHYTVLEDVLRQCADSAMLAVEILDRNLYERSNDCRWWALDSRLRKLMEQAGQTDTEQKHSLEGRTQIETILKHIHALYTVYSNLLVFDTSCTVVAVSNPESKIVPGQQLSDPWLQTVIHHTSASQYSVSPFEPSVLYLGEDSYSYGAAIRSLDNKRVLGGIAITFDVRPQFQQMLKDVLAQQSDAKTLHHSFALFVDHQQRIIASTRAEDCVGTRFEPAKSLGLSQNEYVQQQFTQMHGHHYAAACALARGYREYRSNLNEQEKTMYAYVFLDMGVVSNVQTRSAATSTSSRNLLNKSGHKIHISSFHVGDYWCGVQSERIECAIKLDKIIPIYGKKMPAVLGYVLYQEHSVLLLDTLSLLDSRMTGCTTCNEAVIVKIRGELFALTADRLADTLDVDAQTIHALTDNLQVGSRTAGTIVSRVVNLEQNDDSNKMLQLLDIQRLSEIVSGLVELKKTDNDK